MWLRWLVYLLAWYVVLRRAVWLSRLSQRMTMFITLLKLWFRRTWFDVGILT